MKKYKYRENLQNRTIDPSSGSWDKLAEKLDAHENEKRSRNWMILKIASLILLLVAVGIYYFQPQEYKLSSPEIASPVSKKNLNDITDKKAVEEVETKEKSAPPQIHITEKADVPPISEKSIIRGTEADHSYDEIASSTNLTISKVNDDQDLKSERNDKVATELSFSETPSAEDELLDKEVDQLLHNSKLKLIVNGRISPKKYVNTNALLNSVEDDLDKDLRQKLIEKIVNTLKKDKEVVTSEEN